MKKSIDLSRRRFLRDTSLLSLGGTLGAPFALNLFAMNNAMAAPLTDYKALVCLYLAGGNDSANMVIATDTPSWAGYQAARSGSIALPLANLLPLTTAAPVADSVGTRSFALHPGMAPLQTLFNAGRAAIVANVGTLIRPIVDNVAFNDNAIQKPQNLFSHSDQSALWQSADPARLLYGWGGRVADNLKTNNTLQNFSNISLSGNSVFLAGETLNQYQVNGNGSAVGIGGMTSLFGIGGSPLQTIITTPTSGNVFETEHTAVVQRAIAAQNVLSGVMQATATSVAAPTQYMAYYNYLATNPIAVQLHTVARIIAGQGTLGAHRQIFFINVGGFDTHNGQLAGHGDLMAQLAHAIAYFDTTMTALSMGNNVTLFTASDFGRTLASNGSGTDHGWGANHIVAGGAVNGAKIYGEFALTAMGSSNPLDIGSGRMIPTTSVDQYAATLASWFGVAAADIPPMFPNLANFTTPNLGFMV